MWSELIWSNVSLFPTFKKPHQTSLGSGVRGGRWRVEGTLEGLHPPQKKKKSNSIMYPPWHLPRPKPLPHVPRPMGGITPLVEDVGDLHPVSVSSSSSSSVNGGGGAVAMTTWHAAHQGNWRVKKMLPLFFFLFQGWITHTCDRACLILIPTDLHTHTHTHTHIQNQDLQFTCPPHTACLHVAWMYRLKKKKIKQPANSQAGLWGLSAFRRLDSVSLRLMYIF